MLVYLPSTWLLLRAFYSIYYNVSNCVSVAMLILKKTELIVFGNAIFLCFTLFCAYVHMHLYLMSM